MVLPEGFVVPPLPFLLALLVAIGSILALLWLTDPPVADETVIAFAPWMMLGSTLHVLYKVEGIPASIDVLFSAPTVYVTTAVLAGFTWLLGIAVSRVDSRRSIETPLGGIGVVLFVVAVGYLLGTDLPAGTVDTFWPALVVGFTVIVTVLAWIALRRQLPDVAAVAGFTGVLVVFGHALDGISTAIGYDFLGVSEDVPASQVILHIGETLPTAQFLGAGWLFVLVKVLLAVVVVWLFEVYIRDAPRQARLLLAFIAAVGLGPGVHNVVLFMIV